MAKTLKTVAEITAEIAGIAKAGKTWDARVQACAVACVEHMAGHGDHTLLVKLYQALPKGSRRGSFAQWIINHTSLVANTDAGTKGELPFVKDKAKTTDVEGARENLWTDAGRPEPAPDELFDANKAAMALIRKIKAARDAGRPVKALDAETIAALQALRG